MRNLARAFAAILSMCGICAAVTLPAVYAAESAAPLGAWRTTNNCFLIAFYLTENGRAQAAYMTGEQDADAAWTWDGNTLKITSKMFDLDQFSGHLASGSIEADYVWHDLDKDELHTQACTFERFTPFGL